MKFFFKSPKTRINFQISFIIISLFSIFSIFLLRSNKKVIYMNIQEEILNRLPNISSLNNLFDDSVNPEDRINKIKIFAKKILNINFIKSINETHNNRGDLKRLNLNIPFDNYEIILRDRSKAIKKGVLFNPKWVKGNIITDKTSLNSRFRLKGMRSDHWLANNKLSLKIDLKNGENILGMNSFFLHKLKSRQYPYDFIFQEVLSEMGFPSLNHELVKVNMNNNNWGIMDMQDTFSKEMMGRNKLVESLIIEFSDNKKLEWERYIKGSPKSNSSNEWLYHPRVFFRIVNRDLDDLTDQEKLKFNYIANRLIEIDYQDVIFDNNKLSKMEELLSIWGNFHPSTFRNSKYYLNPFTLKLEPLMSDQEKFKLLNDELNINSIKEITEGFLEPKTLSFIERKKIYEEILFALAKRSPYSLSRKFFPIDSQIKIDKPRKNYEFLKQNNLKYRLNNQDSHFRDKYRCNKNFLNQIPNNFSLINAAYNNEKLIITPLLCGEIQIQEIKICDNTILKNIILNESEISISKPIKLKINGKNKNYSEYICKNSENFIKYKFNGKKYTDKVTYLPFLKRSINPLLEQFVPSFINKNENGDYIAKKGNWNIKDPIIIKGNLFISPNTSFNFYPDTFLIVEGNLNVKGSEKYPVIMKSRNDSDTWKGIYVFNANREENNLSKIDHLQIHNTDRTNIGILNLTGGTTFYNTELKVRNLKIFNSKAEDALNVVNSNVDIKDIYLNNTYSDGVDCDFCKGSIKNLELNNIGGDGVDFSGSDLKVKITSASNIKDKVSSIGEETNIYIEIDNVKNSYLAAAVKDGSTAKIILNNIRTNGPYIMAYDKKNFYRKRTSAEVEHSNKILKKEIKKYVTSFDADMRVNDIDIRPSKIDVEKLYRSGPMKKYED